MPIYRELCLCMLLHFCGISVRCYVSCLSSANDFWFYYADSVTPVTVDIHAYTQRAYPITTLRSSYRPVTVISARWLASPSWTHDIKSYALIASFGHTPLTSCRRRYLRGILSFCHEDSWDFNHTPGGRIITTGKLDHSWRIIHHSSWRRKRELDTKKQTQESIGKERNQTRQREEPAPPGDSEAKWNRSFNWARIFELQLDNHWITLNPMKGSPMRESTSISDLHKFHWSGDHREKYWTQAAASCVGSTNDILTVHFIKTFYDWNRLNTLSLSLPTDPQANRGDT